MRPRSIVAFERLYLAALVLGVIGVVLAWPQLQAMAMSTGSRSAVPALAGALLIGTLIPLLLWYLVARTASVVAKWVCVVLLAVGLLSTAAGAARGGIGLGPQSLLAMLVLVLRIGAVAMLFRPDAKDWFKGEGI